MRHTTIFGTSLIGGKNWLAGRENAWHVSIYAWCGESGDFFSLFHNTWSRGHSLKLICMRFRMVKRRHIFTQWLTTNSWRAGVTKVTSHYGYVPPPVSEFPVAMGKKNVQLPLLLMTVGGPLWEIGYWARWLDIARLFIYSYYPSFPCNCRFSAKEMTKYSPVIKTVLWNSVKAKPKCSSYFSDQTNPRKGQGMLLP